MRPRLVALGLACVLAALAWQMPQVRRRVIRAIVTFDAAPSDPVILPGSIPWLPGMPPDELPGASLGLGPTPRTRVILIDGLSAEVAASLPAWQALCRRGVATTVDVGFPTVSLPVEVELWSGLTQQQTGVVNRYQRPLEPPLRGIPSQLRDSWVVAEHHGWIARSLGFAATEPAAAPDNRIADVDPEGWKTQWKAHARAAVASPSALVFVHVLAVDDAGHAKGGDSAEYRAAAVSADRVLEHLVAAAPDARWFALSDHGHLPRGGHGGEERALRQVPGCIAGPGVDGPGLPAAGGMIHMVDISRAIAESTGAQLSRETVARPLGVALIARLGPDDAVPALALGPGAIVALILAAGLALTIATARAWWLAPWWFVLACAALIVVRGEPTLSMSYVYRPEGRDMYVVWLATLPLASLATWFGARRTSLVRAATAQLAFPIAAAAAAMTASGAWATMFGAEVAPVVPRFTAYGSPLLLMASHGAAAVALAALARLVRPASDRPAPPAPR